MLTSGNYPFEQLLSGVNWLLWTPASRVFQSDASINTQQLPKTHRLALEIMEMSKTLFGVRALN